MATAAIALPKTRRRPRNTAEWTGGRASVPEIYFVKQIDNSRLHREVDLKKRRECYSLLGLGVLVFLFGLLYAWQHLQCVRYDYQIEDLKNQQASLEEWNRRLRLEEASLANPQRIDTLARQELGLAPPGPEQLIRMGPASPSPIGHPEFARNVPAFEPTGGELRREP